MFFLVQMRERSWSSRTCAVVSQNNFTVWTNRNDNKTRARDFATREILLACSPIKNYAPSVHRNWIVYRVEIKPLLLLHVRFKIRRKWRAAHAHDAASEFERLLICDEHRHLRKRVISMSPVQSSSLLARVSKHGADTSCAVQALIEKVLTTDEAAWRQARPTHSSPPLLKRNCRPGQD